MVRRWRANRLLYGVVCALACIMLIVGSATGVLAPLENMVSAPLYFMSGVVNRVALSTSTAASDLAQIRTMRVRIADLEETLAQYQSELVELREIRSDYDALATLLGYANSARNQTLLAANVIGMDTTRGRSTIVINRGTRDGITVGMPVVTAQGLVGRVTRTTANASRVLLMSDPASAISARLQRSRAEGTVQGQVSGTLRMTFIPLDASVTEGDLVLTSGLGGSFPPDIAIGQVSSIRQFESELYQEAEIRSLVAFDTLEFVLVVTSFTPIDLSVFDDPEGQ